MRVFTVYTQLKRETHAGEKHHSPEQPIKLLAESDTRLNAGQSIAQVCQTMGIAESTFHRWRNQYGGMKGEEANRLKALEKENARLKRMVADLMLDKDMLTELVSSPQKQIHPK